MTTAFILRKEFWKHDTGLYHPENSQRLTAIQERLESTSYFSKLNRLQGREATEEDLKLIHDSDYVSKALKRLSLGSGSFDADTPYSEGSYSAALLAAGAGLELADAILEGKAQNGFALVRPPGHHAETNRAMGFCFFNNVAITARYLQKSLKKIFIIDWDVHHGNGTQSSFYEDDTVFFFSSHQYPFYPGTGSFQEIGLGKGKDFTKNHPLQ
ncbi:MAG: histone deacetylase, partial [Leptospiraceae bacterium]|nr:histone deacetylase [Leptospiraceae bacterium]